MSTPENTPDVDAAAVDPAAPSDFVRDQIQSDLDAGTFGGRVLTRFPPEPNGFLHIGHAKAICLNFDAADEVGGRTYLRFDDTNPVTEDADFVTAIQDDLSWLGYEPEEVRFTSDYFDQLYAWAEMLIERGLAYVDDQDAETISLKRGGFTTPGEDSPWRDRTPEENLDLFRRMKAGEFDEGAHVLRARVDMNHQNMQMRDPVIYRIRKVPHHRTGTDWCIYPNYDWAHGQSDAIEGVTHSLCTLEFDSHRPLYDWFLEQLDLPMEKPNQFEFARLAITHIITSKRKLAALVEQGSVDAWDDPRMPTLGGMRRLGYPAESIRAFCRHVGVGKVDGTVEIEMLESFVRTELNKTALRRMAVLDPLKVVIENYPDDQVEWLDAVNNPEDESAGTRTIPFSKVLYLQRDDFMEDPPRKFFRLSPGREVRLRYGYFITCTDVIKDDEGNVIELRCTYDPETSGGQAPDGRKVKATLHWVSAEHALDATVMTYDRLFTDPHPASHDDVDPLDFLNPEARTTIEGAKVEPALAEAKPGEPIQFERLGYFSADDGGGTNPDGSRRLLFHRTVGLRDEWARIQKRN